jgi:hypothetical protein
MAPKQKNTLQTQKKKYIYSDEFVSKIPFFFSFFSFLSCFFVFCYISTFIVHSHTVLSYTLALFTLTHSYTHPLHSILPCPTLTPIYTPLLPQASDRHPTHLHPCVAYPCRTFLPAKKATQQTTSSISPPIRTHTHTTSYPDFICLPYHRLYNFFLFHNPFPHLFIY